MQKTKDLEIIISEKANEEEQLEYIKEWAKKK